MILKMYPRAATREEGGWLFFTEEERLFLYCRLKVSENLYPLSSPTTLPYTTASIFYQSSTALIPLELMKG